MAFFDSLVQREIEGWSSEDVPTTPQSWQQSSNSDHGNNTDSEQFNDGDSDGIVKIHIFLGINFRISYDSNVF